MGKTLQRIISSRAMIVFALKPFSGNSETPVVTEGFANGSKATKEFPEFENFPLQNASVQEKSAAAESSNEEMKWKFLACLLDRLFFFIHVSILVIVISVSECF